MEKYFAAALMSAAQIGSKRAAQLIKHFGTAENAWAAEEIDLLDAGLQERAANALVELRRRFPNMAEEIKIRCDAKKIKLCGIDDEEYPKLLKTIDDAPLLFYYKGELQPKAMRVSIVGTREVTRYGETVTLELAEDLAASGMTIVSGGAVGIDSFAHRGALKGGRTVAVMGCGLEYIYPPENRRLFDRIVENGAVISEYPPKTQPNRGLFPRRNRLIAGLSLGVCVVEAGNASGALDTARHAINYGRELFAVPGSVHAEKSKGCNELIRNGATLIRSAADIFKAFDLNVEPIERNAVEVPVPDEPLPSTPPSSARKKSAADFGLEGDEAAVFDALDDTPIVLDNILIKLDGVLDREISPQELSMILLRLSFQGLAIEDDAGNYSRGR